MGLNRFMVLIAAIVSAAFLGGMALVFSPESWNNSRIAASALVLFSIWLYVIVGRHRSTDVNLGLLGITGFLCLLQLLFAVRILFFALGSDSGLALALCVAGFASGLLLIPLVGVAARIIGDNIRRNDTPGEFPKIARALADLTGELDNPPLRAGLIQLSEDLRYYPRHILEDGALDPAIRTHLDALTQHVQARAFDQAGAALASLRLALERAKVSIQANYSKV